MIEYRSLIEWVAIVAGVMLVAAVAHYVFGVPIPGRTGWWK
jgi:hypothetical protein